MRDHALDEHESLKLFTSDLEGMTLGEGYDEKLHQLMEVGLGFYKTFFVFLFFCFVFNCLGGGSASSTGFPSALAAPRGGG